MKASFFYTGIIGLTSGIFFRSFFDIGLSEIAFVFLLSLALLIAWGLRTRDRNSTLFLFGIFLVACGIGIVRFDIAEQSISPLHEHVGTTGLFEGIVVREPDIRESSQHLYIRESETSALFLVTTNQYEEIQYGDKVSVRGALEVPESFETDTGRTFDYSGYLKAKGVTEMISFGKVTVLETNLGNPIMSTLLGIKRMFMDALEASIPEPAVGLGEGLLLGVKRAIGEDLGALFRTVGIIHIVVLSGYNIMIVADSVMRFLELFFFPRTRLILGILTIILFTLLVGLSATVVRASIMAVLVLIARNTGRQYAVLRALCITGAVMLIHNPYLLAFDPGFELSFLATLGLILFSPLLEKRFTYVPETLGIRGYLATTMGTQLFVLPILLFSMGNLSLVSIVVNVLVLPMVPIAMFATFIVGLAGLVSTTIGVFVGFGAHLVLAYIIKVAELFALLPYASLTIPVFPFWIVILMYLGIIVLTYWLTRTGKRAEYDSTIDRTIVGVNDYEGWVIEEEKETSPGTRSVSREIKPPLPFR